MSLVAAIQMRSTNKVNENLKAAAVLIEQAALKGAVLAVLPEMFAIFGSEQDKLCVKETYGSGLIQDTLAYMAQKHNIWLVAGTIPLTTNDPNRIRAASIVFDNHGKAVMRYDKIYLFDAYFSKSNQYQESKTTEAGSEIKIIQTPAGKLGVSVCFDLRFINIFNTLNQQGVEIIAVPAAFTAKTGKAHWKLLCRSRAIDTFSYIIGAGQGGWHDNGRKTYGHSMIIDPWGKIIAKANALQSQVIIAEINLNYLKRVRRQIPMQF